MIMKRKKVISGIFLSFFLCALVFSISRMETKAASSNTVIKAYDSYITSLRGTVTVPYMNGYDYDNNMIGKWKTGKKTVTLSDFTHYSLRDINGDGKAELFLSTDESPYGEERFVLICTYRKGKVKPVFCVGGLRGGLTLAKGNQICFLFGGSDCGNTVFLKLNGAKLQRMKSYTYVDDKSKVPYQRNYYKGKKATTKAKYDKALTAVQEQITFESIA